ncbi:glutaminyl-peptide cyclotransferase [Polaribacter sp. IC073]|uniref:glutaminyl-peptide cyclotransferase n=1 Tax=Polaribacter sp. IC073 TaxID=2508540 RepID=UPI0011BFC46E|nr:glutaminyl-peptide cyclotransferase [Polaribacter sp. IC073]TXD46575.1 glutaminyl-peptide cyclotransferase [Polaribacter sp. IC073]
MKNYSILISFLTLLFLTSSCANDYKFSLEKPNKVVVNESVTIKLTEKNDKPVDKVQFYINGKEVASEGNIANINTTDLGVGKHAVNALAFFNGKTKKENGFIEVFANTKPAIYTYKIINEYPHDKKAYTQGLEYYNGFLYETTGRRGESTLRKVEIETGKVLQKVSLDDKYFGEGMTIVNNKIIWLTWENKKGFVYDLETFKQEKEFAYNKSKEGWGLTQNKTELIKSDGSHKIWFLDKDNYTEKSFIQVYSHDRAVDHLNELELVNGKIYANYYQKSVIAIINPESGIVEGLANLKGLEKEMAKTQNLVANDEVLNGIAYDDENNRLFVTGKYWGKLFEIELIKQ